jgi:hypothetical protein
MGKSLGGIDISQLMEVMDVPSKERTEISHNLFKIKTAVDSSWFYALFGQDVTLAMLKTSIDPRQVKFVDPKAILDAVVFLAMPKQPVQILESLNNMFASKLSVNTQKYRQWEINSFVLENGQPFYYTLTNKVMIAGFSITPVERCLDQSLDASTSLIKVPVYQRHCADLYKSGKTDYVVFANAGNYITFLQEAISHKAENNPGIGQIISQLEKLQGIETINFAQYDDGGPLVSLRLIMGIDKAKMSHRLKSISDIKPAKNHTLKYIPFDSLFYNWQNTFDLKLYWHEFQQHPEMTPETVTVIKQNFFRKTGMEIESILDAFGSQAGIMIKDINMEGVFPFPELALFIKVKKADVVNKLIKQQTNKINIPVQHETYRENDLQYVMLPLGDNLSPAYTYLDGFFILTINRGLLKTMLDVQDNDGLIDNKNFKSLGKDMTSDNNQVFYLNTEDLFAKTRELITWGINWTAITNKDKAEKAKKIMELGINPLLDGLSMIKAVGVNTCIKEDSINSDMRVLLDRS